MLSALRISVVLCLFSTGFLPGGVLWSSAQSVQSIQNEEEELDYYQKWLEQDVIYMITPEEKQVFLSLTSPEEKERFIEQFWQRRDPDPRTQANEFKEEHYRRIAYANERFTSGFDGWKTDRGRTYIIFGPPSTLEKHPAGGPYERPAHEGGGRTNTYPFEVWRYNHLPGIGENIEIEFVDPSLTSEYRMAVTAEEKDALFLVGNTGLTIGEEMGIQSRLDRVRGRFAANREDRLFDFRRAQDMPFARFRQYVELQKPQPIRFTDLQQTVQTNISYHDLPLSVSQHWFRISDDLAVVPITLMVSNRELTYQSADGSHVARVELYGRVQSLTGELISEFDDTLSSRYDDHSYPLRYRERSAYQRVLLLTPGIYKLTVVSKDVHGSKIGTQTTRLEVPHGNAGDLSFSSLIASRQLKVLDHVPEHLEPFVLGDVKIIPQLDQQFYVGDRLYLYFHLYNVPVDPAIHTPLVDLTYSLFGGGKKILEISGSSLESMLRFSEERAIIVRALDLKGLPTGRYRLEIEANDPVQDRAVSTGTDFKIVELPKARR